MILEEKNMAATKETKKAAAKGAAPKGKKSDSATKGAARAPHRSLFYAMGYTDEELDRPLVGVCCAKNEIIPGHFELDKIAEAVKAGIRMAGGTPIEFPATFRDTTLQIPTQERTFRFPTCSRP